MNVGGGNVSSNFTEDFDVGRATKRRRESSQGAAKTGSGPGRKLAGLADGERRGSCCRGLNESWRWQRQIQLCRRLRRRPGNGAASGELAREMGERG